MPSLAEQCADAWVIDGTAGAALLERHLDVENEEGDPAFIAELATRLAQGEGLRRLREMERVLRRRRRTSKARRCVLDAMLAAATPADLPALFDRAVSTRDMDVAEAAAQRIGAAESVEAAIVAGEWLVYSGNVSAAAQQYQHALDADPLNPRALLGMAVVCLEDENSDRARRYARRAARNLTPSDALAIGPFIRSASALWTGRRPIRTTATVFFCHATTKLKKHADLGPPGVGLLATAVAGWRAHLQPAGRAVVMYDHRQGEEAYRGTLVRFCADQGLDLVVNEGNGLRRQWLAAFATISADALLIIEQDHEFLSNCPTLAQMMTVLAARPDLSHLRLNRRSNVRLGFDKAMEQGGRDRSTGIVRTSRFSNTPHLIRRDYYDRIVLPLIADVSRWDGGNSGAAGVEESINAFLTRAEKIVGLPALMRLAGTAIWGNPGDPRVINHLGF